MNKHKVPKGFLINGIHCGFKRKRKDISLIFSKTPFKVAAMFTKNTVKGAPVIDARKKLSRNGLFNAVLINSGNANCLTGRRGLSDCRKMAEMTAKELGVKQEEVLISSTGIIGKYLDLSPLNEGLSKLVRDLRKGSLEDAARGMMTTDDFPKVAYRSIDIAGEEVILTGLAKGAGMVKPEMATMLSFLMTDADISQEAMKKALKEATDQSFNRITVDGDMSTNDTVMLLANSEAGNKTITDRGQHYEKFSEALKSICLELAEMIVYDGESASKFIGVTVSGAASIKKAEKIGEAIADSLLVKCAVLGEDPNWGRIASSAGSAKEMFNIDKIEIILDGVCFYKKGRPVQTDIKARKGVFKGRRVEIELKLNEGKKSARFYSCDISDGYIKFNAHYTT